MKVKQQSSCQMHRTLLGQFAFTFCVSKTLIIKFQKVVQIAKKG